MKIFTIMICIIIIPLTTAQTDNVTLELKNTYLPIINGNTIIETELLYNNNYVGYMDNAECELDIYDNTEERFEIVYRSLFNKGDATYTYNWNNIHNGNYTLIQYCQYGNVLNQDRIYLYANIEVSGV
jgi:hypothetical protein